MAGNWWRVERADAQGYPLLRLTVRGPDVVGNAHVYLNLDEARRLRDHLAEEITIAEASGR